MTALACEVYDDLMHREPVDLSDDPVTALREYLAYYVIAGSLPCRQTSAALGVIRESCASLHKRSSATRGAAVEVLIPSDVRLAILAAHHLDNADSPSARVVYSIRS